MKVKWYFLTSDVNMTTSSSLKSLIMTSGYPFRFESIAKYLLLQKGAYFEQLMWRSLTTPLYSNIDVEKTIGKTSQTQAQTNTSINLFINITSSCEEENT